ncbi:MAG TPA: hypothetical protein VMR98_00645 [Candidatus Polarisedimenticolaceae bacterium]|nr:hypothetical protein [Candidatus Polarisedimenticolaceae bacterium]
MAKKSTGTTKTEKGQNYYVGIMASLALLIGIGLYYQLFDLLTAFTLSLIVAVVGTLAYRIYLRNIKR